MKSVLKANPKVQVAIKKADSLVKRAEKKSPSWKALHAKAVASAKAKRHEKGGRR